MTTTTYESHLIRGCPECGLLSALPEKQKGMAIICPRCFRVLSRARHHSFDYLLACALAGLLFGLVLLAAPFIHIFLYGRFQNSTLWTGVEALDHEQLTLLAFVVMLTALIFPLIKLTLMNIVLIGVRHDNTPPYLPALFRFLKKISPWAMLEVYLLGFLVAYTRLKAMAYIQMDTAVYALCGAILLTAAVDADMDSEEIWAALKQGSGARNQKPEVQPLLSCPVCNYASPIEAGDNCPRCDTAVHERHLHSLQHAWAYLISALVFYIPANCYPIMNITQLGSTSSYTITGGMMELYRAGFLPLAILVFTASIAIPLLKIISLLYMLLATHRHSGHNLVMRMRLYRVIRFIGRWSMVDVFMLSIMVALMQFGQIARITSGLGALCFAAVVVLTMLAVESFDTRLMWDRAGKNNDTVIS